MGDGDNGAIVIVRNGPPCSQAWSAGYASATVMSSQMPSDNTAVAACKRRRQRRFM